MLQPVQRASMPSHLAVKLSAAVRPRHSARRSVQLVEINTERVLLQLSTDVHANEWVWLDILGVGSRYVLITWRYGDIAEAMFAAPVTEALLQSALDSLGRWTERDSMLLRDIAACCYEAAEDCPSEVIKSRLVTVARKCRVRTHMMRLTSHLQRQDEAATHLAERLSRLSVAYQPTTW